ncbi:hypothetical protein SUGI_0978260 [Cryptomeria japonica]|nr:hypothetical protein SUGI_0978260 [Cryptomeria japonica]
MMSLTGLLLVQGEGEQQSPIDIQTAYVQSNQTLGELEMDYSAGNATMTNTGDAIQVEWSEDAGNLEIGGVEYRLKQCHWHHPSEHTINDIAYDLELHLVHQSDNGMIAVIGILYSIDDEYSDNFLTMLEEAIENIDNVPEIDLNFVDPNMIEIESDAAYYRYCGSLTTYPFTEGVTWTIIKQAKKVNSIQVESLKNALPGDNARAVQQLNGRVVEEYDISETCKAKQTILSSSS